MTSSPKLKPGLKIFRISPKTGQGMKKWYDGLLGRQGGTAPLGLIQVSYAHRM